MRRRAKNDIEYVEKEYSLFDRDLIKATENFDSKDYVPDARYFNVGKISRNRFYNVECESSPHRKTLFNLRSFSSTLKHTKSTVKIDTFNTSAFGLTKGFC